MGWHGLAGYRWALPRISRIDRERRAISLQQLMFLLARQAGSRLAYVLLLLLSFFLFFHVFNDRLEQRDLRICQTDLHQIFRVGRHVSVTVDVQSSIRFAITQGTLSWQTILGAKSAKSPKRLHRGRIS